MVLEKLFIVVFLRFALTPLVLYYYDSKKLRKYPNQNILSGVTNLASIRERLRRFRTRELYFQHQKHPIIRVAPNMLSFRDVKAIKDIYGFGSPCQKHEMYKPQNGEGHMNILNVIDREDHNRKCRMLSHAFSTENLESWEFKITDKVEKLVAQFDRRAHSLTWKNGPNQPNDSMVDVRYWFSLFTVDAIADIALSERLGMLESGSDVVKVGGPGEEDSAHQFIEDMHEAALVKSKIIDGENLDDILTCLTKDKAGKSRDLDMGELKAETSILLDAGPETTAIALTHLLYYLIKNPDCFVKLRKEVSGAIAGDKVAPYAKVRCLPYLKACIEESLRLSPRLPQGLERFIPGNVGVSVPAYVAHWDPDLFPEPEAFLPERWFKNENIGKMRDAFIPFSAGGRAYIGRNITMIEQQILIGTLVHR
ncbi:cytochrome P450 [Aspergillus transmontanensis]|uniref:Cytochrome P450 n=1 Tax=Aspergillus transmontanensis TaxID=1034304 RepID=A0A5N6W717_9EURO|nr:cytochrome P450 [Aspergillus transmontanensis]